MILWEADICSTFHHLNFNDLCVKIPNCKPTSIIQAKCKIYRLVCISQSRHIQQYISVTCSQKSDTSTDANASANGTSSYLAHQRQKNHHVPQHQLFSSNQPHHINQNKITNTSRINLSMKVMSGTSNQVQPQKLEHLRLVQSSIDTDV